MSTNSRIIRVLIVISALFLALLTYLLYFNMFKADEIFTNPYNRRQWDEEKFVTRGKIYDSRGLVLAETVTEGDTIKRVYSQGNLYSHIIGYCSPVYGKSLLEKEYDRELLGKDDIRIFMGEKRNGFDLNLTVDNEFQQYAYSQMSGKTGALVAIEPHTGKILAMVSLPDYNPQAAELESGWAALAADSKTPLMNRAAQGLYPPGSTYKIVTAAAAFENGLKDKIFEDTGAFVEGDLRIENYKNKVYGTVSLEDAFKVSSNQVFSRIGYDLGADVMKNISERFGINSQIVTDFPVAVSSIGYENMVSSDSAMVAIGQGQLQTTPIQMAMICSAVANGGNLVQPYVVESVTKGNSVVTSTQPKVIGRAVSEECADYLEKIMVETVKSGTGTQAQISGVTVAGKTGTAENGTDKDHAWFVGYAPAENPQIAVAVILENDGTSGGDSAAPIAGRVMEKYLTK